MVKKKLTTKQKRSEQTFRLVHKKISEMKKENERLKKDIEEQELIKEIEENTTIKNIETNQNTEHKEEQQYKTAEEKTIIDDFDQQLSSNEPIRELTTGKNIKFKTELSEEQRGSVSILYHAYRVLKLNGVDFDGLKYVLDEYIDFGVSVDRKGRTEFVEAQKINNTANQNPNNQNNGVNNQMNNMRM